MIDHDRLFKELLSTFFIEFIELFFPEVITYLQPESVTFLDKEVFTDVTIGEQYETDLLAQVQFRGEETYFLIHVENQASSDIRFNKRMFRYFARLHEKFDLPIYPIVVFSYDQPKKPAGENYTVEFPDFAVLQFNYRVIQLNRLHWRDFLNQRNPVASALMAKMKIAPQERPRVKLECLRLLATLRLDPARMQLISGFVDTYLRLSESEAAVFDEELSKIEPREIKEGVMQLTTSWKEEGLREGRREGIEREQNLVIRQLKRRLGSLTTHLEDQVKQLPIEEVEALGEALLDFEREEDLVAWLEQHT